MSRQRPVSGKSLQAMMGTLIRDLKLDNGVEDVFKKLIDSSDEDGDGLELDKKTSDGDTLLHRITHATVDSPGNMKYYMQLVDKICSKSGQWYVKHKSDGKEQNTTLQAFKNYGMTNLLEKFEDGKRRNVWDLAIVIVAIDMIEKLMYLEDVTCKGQRDSKVFVVSKFVDIKFSVGSLIGRWCKCFHNMDDFEVKLPKLLQQTKGKNKIDELLRVKPMKKMTDAFCSVSTKIYIVVVLLHLMYMSLFSYLGCELMDARNPEPTLTTKGLMYSFGFIEPILLLFYLLNQCLKLLLFITEQLAEYDYFVMYKETRKINFLLEVVWFLIISGYTFSLFDVIVGTEILSSRRNILSVCLLLGWLLTFALADGIRQIHFFFKLIIRIMINDVLRILLVYIIFLFGFSLSIHAQFISSANITMTYKTPVHTMYLMFNVMVGMEEAVDENTEAYLEAVSVSPLFSKLLYIGYVICSTIVLLNLLIAMMNTSYSTIEVEHINEWVFNAAHFGLKVAIYFPALAKLLGSRKIKKKKLFYYSEPVWTIKLSDFELEFDYSPSDMIKYTDKDFRGLKYEIEHSEKILKAQIYDMKKSQNEIMNCIKDLQAKMDRTTQDHSNPEHPQSNQEANK